MNSIKYFIISTLIGLFCLNLSKKTMAENAPFSLKNGDIIAFQAKENNTNNHFCYVNESSLLVCNERKKITDKSLFKVKVIDKKENIVALSVGPDFTNYCQYDDSSKNVLRSTF